VDFQTYLLVFRHSIYWFYLAFAVGCAGGSTSSAKPRSSSWVQSVHCMSFCFCAVDVFMTRSMNSRNKNGDINLRG
jgi:hypothetical protein